MASPCSSLLTAVVIQIGETVHGHWILSMGSIAWSLFCQEDDPWKPKNILMQNNLRNQFASSFRGAPFEGGVGKTAVMPW